MIDVTVEVKAKGVDSDFESDASVKYYRVKSKAEVNLILRKVADALFSMGDEVKEK